MTDDWDVWIKKKFPPDTMEQLPSEEADRRADQVIGHIEETRPEIWLSFLYEQGLHSVLARYLDENPFGSPSPTSMAIQREIDQLYPDLTPWKVRQIFAEMTRKTTDDLISKYLDFNPPEQI